MTYTEYISYTSEIAFLKALIEEIPEENVIERFGLEYRLQSLQEVITNISKPELVPVDTKGETKCLLKKP